MGAGLDIAGLASGITDLGLELAGNAKTTATLHLGKIDIGGGDYNFDTDKTEVDTVAGGSDVQVEGVLYRSRAQQAAAVGNDAIFLINGKDVPDGVSESDSLTINGVIWNIFQIEVVPTDAVILIYIRR